jgi:ABC-type phosphate/phosphonate transport system substrate-binding protein
MNKVLGTRFKIVSGYRFGAAGLAVERGEVDGMCGWGYASLKALKSHWLEKGFIRILLQVGQKKHADLPNVPLASELVTDPQAKQLLQMWDTQLAVGRPWMTPQGVPEDRVRILRQAFLDVMKDPKFLNDARKAKIEINPLAGDQVQALVQKILATPTSVRDFLKEIFRY